MDHIVAKSEVDHTNRLVFLLPKLKFSLQSQVYFLSFEIGSFRTNLLEKAFFHLRHVCIKTLPLELLD